MPDTHRVAPGDNLTKIAKKYGYASWRDLYFHPDNKAFRKRRPDPNKIRPGDVIALPKQKKAAAAAAPAQAAVKTDIKMTLPWNFAAKLKMPTVLPLYPAPLPLTSSGASTSSSNGTPSPDTTEPALTTPRPDPHRAPSCLNATLPVPLPPQPLRDEDKPTAMGSLGSALWACREVQEPIIDLLWNNAPAAQKGIEIGVGVTALSTLLILNATRDTTLNLFEGFQIPAGSAYPEDWAGARWIRPIKPSIIWHETDRAGWNRGVMINYDFSGEMPELFK